MLFLRERCKASSFPGAEAERSSASGLVCGKSGVLGHLHRDLVHL